MRSEVRVIRRSAPQAPRLRIEINLPTDASFVSATPTQGVCAGAAPVICHLGDLAPGASASVTLVVAAPGSPGLLIDSARAATAVIDPVAGNNNSTESTTVGSADADGDGMPEVSDCSPGDGTLWVVPSEATDLTPSTAILYYLVRSKNPCGGNLGTRSDGAPRTAGSCL